MALIPSIFDFIFGFRTTVETKQENVESAQITTQGRTRAGGPWIGPYEAMDVTYPQIMNSTLYAFGATNNNTSGPIAHSHVINAVSASSALFNIPQNQATGAYLTATQNRFVNLIGCFAGPGAVALAGGQIWFQVFRENPDGSLTRYIHDDIYSSINGAVPLNDVSWLELTVPGGFVVRQGERYLFRLLNKTSPARTIAINGIATADATPYIQHWSGAGGALATETDYTALQAAGFQSNGAGVIPWFYIASQSPPPEDVTYTDDFNRANLGINWSWLGRELGADADLVISDGHLVYSELTDGVAQVDYIHPTASDYMRVDVDVHEVQGTYAAADVGVTVLMNCDREGYYSAAFTVTGDSVIFATEVNGGGYVERDVVMTVGNNTTWSFIYNPDTNTYYALKTGEDVGLSWTDSGDIMLQGANYRYTSIQISRESGVNGGEVDNWVYRDWRA